MHVDVGFDDHGPFRPDVARHGVEDDLPGLALEAWRHRDHHEERHARRRPHRYVLDGRELRLERAQERRFEWDLLEDVVLGHRLAGEQALKDRLLAVGDGGDLRHRFERGRRVVAGVFAERAFHHRVVHVDFEFDHHFGG